MPFGDTGSRRGKSGGCLVELRGAPRPSDLHAALRRLVGFAGGEPGVLGVGQRLGQLAALQGETLGAGGSAAYRPGSARSPSSLASVACMRAMVCSASVTCLRSGARCERFSAAAGAPPADRPSAPPAPSTSRARVPARTLAQQLGAVARPCRRRRAHGAAAHQPQPVGRRLDQVPVVADQDDGALVVGERARPAPRGCRRRDGWSARRGSAGAGAWKVASANSSRAFSPPERFSALVSALSMPKPERAEPGAALRLRRLRHQGEHVLIGRAGRRQVVHLVLGEIADGRACRTPARPAMRREPAGDQLGERGLAVAVGAEQADAVVVVEAQVEAAQHRPPGDIADGRVLEAASAGSPGALRAGERERHARAPRSARRSAACAPAPSCGSAPAWPWTPWP